MDKQLKKTGQCAISGRPELHIGLAASLPYGVISILCHNTRCNQVLLRFCYASWKPSLGRYHSIAFPLTAMSFPSVYHVDHRTRYKHYHEARQGAAAYEDEYHLPPASGVVDGA